MFIELGAAVEYRMNRITALYRRFTGHVDDPVAALTEDRKKACASSPCRCTAATTTSLASVAFPHNQKIAAPAIAEVRENHDWVGNYVRQPLGEDGAGARPS